MFVMGDRSSDLRIRKLTERALKDRGVLPLAVLLEVVVPVSRLRALAQDLALSPKGFRIESAPARVLAPLLADRTDPSEMEKVVGLLLEPLLRAQQGDPSISDAAAAEQAVADQAVLLFCTEGHAYPGLEVKKMGGQDTWSLRASLGLRVYFKDRDDGDIDVLELADREEQHTTLRGLKDR